MVWNTFQFNQCQIWKKIANTWCCYSNMLYSEVDYYVIQFIHQNYLKYLVIIHNYFKFSIYFMSIQLNLNDERWNLKYVLQDWILFRFILENLNYYFIKIINNKRRVFAGSLDLIYEFWPKIIKSSLKNGYYNTFFLLIFYILVKWNS